MPTRGLQSCHDVSSPIATSADRRGRFYILSPGHRGSRSVRRSTELYASPKRAPRITRRCTPGAEAEAYGSPAGYELRS